MNYRSGAVNIGNVFSHITLKNCVGDFPDVAWFFFYTLLKFDVFNADVSFYKRGRNFETKAKSKKARHRFSKEVSWDIPADFQPIPLEDARKRTENVHPSMQFSLISRKRRKIRCRYGSVYNNNGL